MNKDKKDSAKDEMEQEQKGKRRHHSAAWKRCVEKLKDKPGVNAYAVCTATMRQAGNLWADGKKHLQDGLEEPITVDLDAVASEAQSEEDIEQIEELRAQGVEAIQLDEEFEPTYITNEENEEEEEGKELEIEDLEETEEEEEDPEEKAHMDGHYSHQEVYEMVNKALRKRFKESATVSDGPMISEYSYFIRDLFPDAVVVEDTKTGKLYSIDYAITVDDVEDMAVAELADEMVRVELEYVPTDGGTSKSITDREDREIILPKKKNVSPLVPQCVYALRLSKNNFPTRESAEEWLQIRDFKSENLQETDLDWYAAQKPKDTEKLHEIALATDVWMYVKETDKAEVKAALAEAEKTVPLWCHAEVEIQSKAKDKGETDMKKLLNAKDFIIEGWASTQDLDRTKDVVHAEAFKEALQDYALNPIVLYMHKPDRPIGTAEVQIVPGKGLFARANISRTEQEVRTKILEGILRAFSFGFRPQDEKSVRQGDDLVRHIKRLELFEISVVPIPMNKRALFSFTKALELGSDLVCKSCGEECHCKKENDDGRQKEEKEEGRRGILDDSVLYLKRLERLTGAAETDVKLIQLARDRGFKPTEELKGLLDSLLKTVYTCRKSIALQEQRELEQTEQMKARRVEEGKKMLELSFAITQMIQDVDRELEEEQKLGSILKQTSQMIGG